MRERYFNCCYDYRRKSQDMDSQDINKISNKAKSETEAFINQHLNDRAKGWPKSCLSDPNYADYFQKEQDKNVRYQKCS